MTGLPSDWVTQGGAVGLLGLAFLMVMTGLLVPRSFYRQAVRERDEWKTVALRSMDHTDALIEGNEVTAQVVRALGDSTDPRLPAVGGGERT